MVLVSAGFNLGFGEDACRSKEGDFSPDFVIKLATAYELVKKIHNIFPSIVLIPKESQEEDRILKKIN